MHSPRTFRVETTTNTRGAVRRPIAPVYVGFLAFILASGCSCEVSVPNAASDASPTRSPADASDSGSSDASPTVGSSAERDASADAAPDASTATIDVTLQGDAGADGTGLPDSGLDAASTNAGDSGSSSSGPVSIGSSEDGGDVGSARDAGPDDFVVGATVFVSGGACGLAYDATRDLLFVYPCSGSEILAVDALGSVVLTLDAPGEAANDVDLDVTTAPLSLATTSLPVGTLLFVNGEVDVAEVYAVDVENDVVLTSLNTSFGASHVVGGAHHFQRGSLFLVQDRVPGATDGNVVAEIDPSSGLVEQLFSVASNFDVNYGDLDVCESTSNLLLVSSNENRVAEFTPEREFVRAQPLPPEVTELSGIAVDSSTGRIWVASTGGNVTRLDSNLCPASL